MASSTYTMATGYGERFKRASNYTRSLCPKIQQCTRQVLTNLPPATKTFRFCDFGAADGYCTAILVQSIAECVSTARGQRFEALRELDVVLEDQKQNDFRPALNYIERMLEEKKTDTDVFVSSVGRSYFEQCLPSGSVSLSSSLQAAHYFDVRTPLKGFPTGFTLPLIRRLGEAKGNRELLQPGDTAWTDALKEKAAREWEAFLVHRAAELQVGGQLVVATIVDIPYGSEDYMRFSTGRVECNMYDTWWHIATALHELAIAGDIDGTEEDNCVLPTYRRTLDEVKAPFLDSTSPVRKAGLQLLQAEHVLSKHPEFFSSESLAHLSEAEMRSKALEYSRQIEGFIAPMVRVGLSKASHRNEDEVDVLVRKAMDRAAALMAEKKWVNTSEVLFLLVAEKV